MSPDERKAHDRALQSAADTAPNVYLTLRELKCVALRLSGADYEDIASVMELPTAERARQIIAKASRKLTAAYDEALAPHMPPEEPERDA